MASEPKTAKLYETMIQTSNGPVRVWLEEYCPCGDAEETVFILRGEMTAPGGMVLVTEGVSLEPGELARNGRAKLREANKWLEESTRHYS